MTEKLLTGTSKQKNSKEAKNLNFTIMYVMVLNRHRICFWWWVVVVILGFNIHFRRFFSDIMTVTVCE